MQTPLRQLPRIPATRMCAAPAFRKLGVDGVSREFSAAWRREKKHTAAHASVRWRFTPHGCFSPERGLLKPSGGVTQICNKRPQDLRRIYGSTGTSSGLLILPVARSSCEIVAPLTGFWKLSPWVLAADVCLLSFPSGFAGYLSSIVWTSLSFRLDLGQVGI